MADSMYEPQNADVEFMQTDEAPSMMTGLPVSEAKPEERVVAIRFGADNSISYSIGEGLGKHEIIGAMSVISEQLKRELIFDNLFLELKNAIVKELSGNVKTDESSTLTVLKKMVEDLENGNLRGS